MQEKLSTRFSWNYHTPASGGLQIDLICNKENPDQKQKRANLGQVWQFFMAGHDGIVYIKKIEEHMRSLTDDLCEGFYPREHEKKKKKQETI